MPITTLTSLGGKLTLRVYTVTLQLSLSPRDGNVLYSGGSEPARGPQRNV